MDAGLTSRPVAGVAVTDYARPAVAATAGTAATDLPTSQTVTPAADTTPTQNNTQPPPTEVGLAAYDVRSVTIDPQTREVIYRVLDSRTNQVVTQIPDQTLLRNRAYSQAIADGKLPVQAQFQADLEA
jgi:flagellar protein FlaG